METLMSLTAEERRDALYAIKHFQQHHISPSTDRYTYYTHILEKIENEYDDNQSNMTLQPIYAKSMA